MPGSATKSIETAALRDLGYCSGTRPLGVSKIKNREDLGLMVIATRNCVNCFDFIGTK
jgi:hypothetical protein